MKKLLVSLTMMAFSASPAAFGSQVSAEQLYKNTYIELKQGKDSAEVLRNLIVSAKSSKMEVKEVLEAAVTKGWMSQDQLNTVLEVAAKNSNLADKAFAEKLAAGKVSQADMKSLSDALQGQVTGASYRCGYYGCYRNGGSVAAVFLIILLLALLTSPVYVVYY